MWKSIFYLAVAVLSSPLIATTARAESCEAADQFIAWRGGDAFRTLASFEATGSLVMQGLKGTARQVMRRDGYMYFEFSVQGYEGTEVVTPEGGWEKSISGQVGHMGEARVAANRRAIDEAFALSLIGQGHGTVSCPGRTEKDGTDYNTVRVSFEDGNWFEYFVGKSVV